MQIPFAASARNIAASVLDVSTQRLHTRSHKEETFLYFLYAHVCSLFAIYRMIHFHVKQIFCVFYYMKEEKVRIIPSFER